MREAGLVIQGTPTSVLTSGGLTTNASGKGQDEMAPTTLGDIAVVAGAFTAKLTTNTGFVANITCTPVSGTGIALGTIKIATPPTTAPTSTAPTATATGFSSGTASVTSTAAPAPSGSSTSPAGPIVSADDMTTSNTNSTAGIAGLDLTAVGFVALGGAVGAWGRSPGCPSTQRRRLRRFPSTGAPQALAHAMWPRGRASAATH